MRKYLYGISLIEALITLLVLSIGLLGLGQLQARLWSSSGSLHATSNAWLLGSATLEILTATQIITSDLLPLPPSQALRSGTLFNTTVSVNEGKQLTSTEIRVIWEGQRGSQAIDLESVANTVSRAFDTRLLLPIN